MEASPEQLSRCAAAAEQFTSQGNVRTRVIGWYHSHPHITVLPSHVDIKTQATYQMLDQGFIGLIFSTFNQVSAQCKLQLHMLQTFLKRHACASQCMTVSQDDKASAALPCGYKDTGQLPDASSSLVQVNDIGLVLEGTSQSHAHNNSPCSDQLQCMYPPETLMSGQNPTSLLMTP